MSKSRFSSSVPYLGVRNYDPRSYLEEEMEMSRRTAIQSTSNPANITIHKDRIEFDSHSKDLILSEVKKVKKSDEDNVIVVCSTSGEDAALFTLRFDTKKEFSKVLEILENYSKSYSGSSSPLTPEKGDAKLNSNTSNSLTRPPKSRGRSNSHGGNNSLNSQSGRSDYIKVQRSRNSSNTSNFFPASNKESSERSFNIVTPLESHKSGRNSKNRNLFNNLKSKEITTPPAEIRIMRETPKKLEHTSFTEISSSTSVISGRERVPTLQETVSNGSAYQVISGKMMTSKSVGAGSEGSHGRLRRRKSLSSSTSGLSMETTRSRSSCVTLAQPRYGIVNSTAEICHEEDSDTLTDTSGYCESTTYRPLPVHCCPDFKVVFPLCYNKSLSNKPDKVRIYSRTIEKQHASLPVRAVHSFRLC
ncbi:unnamed protein product [Hymenolepis diminuta]|uniref:DUF5734 domain-containing protein n=1 Tax=Hymenolepis diminuta TaxID=6216 RepID=A0A0R3SUD5_HYMDI|nr:unnamed protein product [Hymenolepis diminuta]VUZ51390.1 unnamed protein product [Hymenolepis diminuta]